MTFEFAGKAGPYRPQSPVLSVVTPAYNEAENLPLLYARLTEVLDGLGLDWEWVVVDDRSADGTFDVVSEVAHRDPRVRGVRFARNFGSHTALTCGLHLSRGDCAVVMAADLQDPPETIPRLLERWREGDNVVWAVRGERLGEKASTIAFSRLYYWIMRRIVGLKEIPSTGADFFLVDRRVVDAFRRFNETNTSILALITWMGFRQSAIVYDKQARAHGTSGWSFAKKLKLVVDSVTSFSFFPIRLMSVVGFVTALIGFAYAAVVLGNALLGHPPQGWSSLMVIVLVVGGMQMLMMGTLGEYLWRTLDASRRRPVYLIDEATDPDSACATGHDRPEAPAQAVL
jgi:dolichol-phosphate mannosyltransferase